MSSAGQRSGAQGPVAALAVLACALVIVACGDDDDQDLTTPDEPLPVEVADPEMPESAPQTDDPLRSDEDVIRAAIEGFYVSGDPDRACEQSATDVFIEESYGDEVGCRAAVLDPGAAADDIIVNRIEVDGDRATARAVPEGGPSGGIELEVKLVKQGKRWRINDVDTDVPPGP